MESHEAKWIGYVCVISSFVLVHVENCWRSLCATLRLTWRSLWLIFVFTAKGRKANCTNTSSLANGEKIAVHDNIACFCLRTRILSQNPEVDLKRLS